MGRTQKQQEKIERRNERLRLKFEKEAHDREREEIMATVNGYNDWISELSKCRKHVDKYGTI